MEALVIGLICIIWGQNACSVPKWSSFTSGDFDVDDFGLPLTDYDYLDTDLSYGNGTMITDTDYGLNLDYDLMDMDYGFLAFERRFDGAVLYRVDQGHDFVATNIVDEAELSKDEICLSPLMKTILAAALETVILRVFFSLKRIRKMKRNLVYRMKRIIAEERNRWVLEKRVMPLEKMGEEEKCRVDTNRPSSVHPTVLPMEQRGVLHTNSPPVQKYMETLTPSLALAAEKGKLLITSIGKEKSQFNPLLEQLVTTVPEMGHKRKRSRYSFSCGNLSECTTPSKASGEKTAKQIAMNPFRDIARTRNLQLKSECGSGSVQPNEIATPGKTKLAIPIIAQKLSHPKDSRFGPDGDGAAKKQIVVPDIREKLKLKNQPERNQLFARRQDHFSTRVIPKNFTDYAYTPGTPVTVEAKTLDGAFSLTWNSHASFRDPESDSKTQTVFRYRAPPTLGVKIPDPELDYFGQAEAPKCRTRKVRFSNAVTVKTLICEEESSYVPKILAKSMKVTEIVEVHRLHNGRGRATMRRLETE